MSDCISLVSTDVNLADVAKWEHTSQLTHVLHTEKITIRSVAKGHLEIEPFCVPNMDCRIVGAVIYHCDGSGPIHSWTPERISHLTQQGDDICVELNCWELDGKTFADEETICWVEDPCERLHLLRCCEMEWLKRGKKKSFSWRDSSGSTSYLTQERLVELISQADMECDAKNCRNSRCITFNCHRAY